MMYAQALRYLRVDIKKWTLRKAAKYLGISHVHLCNLENENHTTDMSMQLLDKINVVYGTNLIIVHLVFFDPTNTLPEKLKRDLYDWLETTLKGQT